MSGHADRWVHPTKFTGEYPQGWNGYTFLDWSKEGQAFHPADDYNFGYGNDDLGQDVYATADGEIVHTSEANTGYGNIIVIRHSLGPDLKQFIKETYGIETDVLYSLYAHLQDILVKAGSAVDAGSVIAHVGMSGTEWAHLHFEIYAPIPDTDWRFWPSGWSKEQIKRYYLPPYKFIESVRSMDLYAQFLGKPKVYWIQVEQERQELLAKLGKKDEEIQQISQGWERRLEAQQQVNQQLQDEIARLRSEIGALQQSGGAQVEQLTKKIRDLERENLDLKERLSAQPAKTPLSEYSVAELVVEIARRIITMFAKTTRNP